MLKIRRATKEIGQDTGGFAAGEVAQTVIGTFFLVPGLITLGSLALFFILGFTTLLGGPLGFFKVLFVIGLLVLLSIIAILRPAIRLLKRGTKNVVDKGIRRVKNELP